MRLQFQFRLTKIQEYPRRQGIPRASAMSEENGAKNHEKEDNHGWFKRLFSHGYSARISAMRRNLSCDSDSGSNRRSSAYSIRVETLIPWAFAISMALSHLLKSRT